MLGVSLLTGESLFRFIMLLSRSSPELSIIVGLLYVELPALTTGPDNPVWITAPLIPKTVRGGPSLLRWVLRWSLRLMVL